jgi:hypothetical protein
MPTYLGIDFSGSQTQWNSNTPASNVWVATVNADGDRMQLAALVRVQRLPGDGRPFFRLSNLLRQRTYAAAAIDAPFSVPWWFFTDGLDDHSHLLQIVNELPLNPAQDFPDQHTFVAAVRREIVFEFTKPLRVTESYWRGRTVEVRCTVWTGGRPGAPFASACVKLLAQAGCEIWPWNGGDTIGVVVEAFPAAQLRQWGLPHRQYNGPAGQANREVIVADLTANRQLQISDSDLATIRTDADALDAVICSYAARAVAENRLGVGLPPFDAWRLEGWIAVHE